MDQGLLALGHLSAQLICKGRRGAPDRETSVISRGQARRGKGGCFPALDQLRLLQEEMSMAVFLLASVSHGKTNAATSGAKRQISVGHKVGSNFLLELHAPDLQTWKSKAWQVASLAQIGFPRKAPAAMAGGASPSNSFDLWSPTRKPKRKTDSKGGGLCKHR